MNDLDNFYLLQKEPLRGCFLALRGIILRSDPAVSEAWKYRMPFFCYNGKMFCYFHVDPKTNMPYAGFVEGNRMNHPKLLQGKRTRMKVIYFDPQKDLPIKTIHQLLNMTFDIYRTRSSSRKPLS